MQTRTQLKSVIFTTDIFAVQSSQEMIHVPHPNETETVKILINSYIKTRLHKDLPPIKQPIQDQNERNKCMKKKVPLGEIHLEGSLSKGA